MDECEWWAYPGGLPPQGLFTDIYPTLLPSVPSPSWPRFNTTEGFCNRSARVEIRQCASGSEYLASIILEWVSLECLNQTERDIKRGVEPEEIHLLQEVVAAAISHQRTLERPSLIPLSVMFALIAILGILGNGLVLYIFGRKLAMTTSTHFVVALAVVDLLTCVLVIPGTAAQAWYAAFSSDGLCKAWQLTRYAILFTPSLLLVSVAVERYILICHPTSRAFMVSSRGLRLALAALFIAGIALAIPPMLSAGTHALIRGTDVKIHVGICINNYMLISRKVIRNYWITVSILYAVFTVALAVLYGLIFCNLYKRRHRWRPRIVQVQPTETGQIYESDIRDITTKPTEDSDDVFLAGQNTSSEMQGRPGGSGTSVKKRGVQKPRRRESAVDIQDKTLMFRHHSMFPAHVEQLNARRREVLRRDFFMSRAEVACILNQPFEPAFTPVKLVPRESTIISVSSYTTETTEVVSDAAAASGVGGNSVKRSQDSENSPGTSKMVVTVQSKPNSSMCTSGQMLSIPMKILKTKDKQAKTEGKGVTDKVQEFASENEVDSEGSITHAENTLSDIRDTSNKVTTFHDESATQTTTTGVGSSTQDDSQITPVNSSDNLLNLTKSLQTNRPSLRVPSPWSDPSPLTPIHRQKSIDGLQRGTGWSSPHGKTAIIWLTVTATFIAAYTPMLLIQTRVIPAFNNSRFLYFAYFFIAALNPVIYSVLNRSFTAALCRLCTCGKCSLRDCRGGNPKDMTN